MILEPAQKAAVRLLVHARELFQRIVGARATGEFSTLPRRFHRNPVQAQRRVARAVEWLDALARTLAGAGTWLLPPRATAPSPPGSGASIIPRLPPIQWPEVQEMRRLAARARTIRRAFATLPTATIARRLANRLGISPHSDFWPADLFTITETPACIARQQRKQHAPRVLQAMKQSEAKAWRLRHYAQVALASVTPPSIPPHPVPSG